MKPRITAEALLAKIKVMPPERLGQIAGFVDFSRVTNMNCTSPPITAAPITGSVIEVSRFERESRLLAEDAGEHRVHRRRVIVEAAVFNGVRKQNAARAVCDKLLESRSVASLPLSTEREGP